MQELGESGKGEIANSHFGISEISIKDCLSFFPYHSFLWQVYFCFPNSHHNCNFFFEDIALHGSGDSYLTELSPNPVQLINTLRAITSQYLPSNENFIDWFNEKTIQQPVSPRQIQLPPYYKT